MQPTIRLFTTDDYPDVVSVMNASAPEYAFTLEAFLAREKRQDPKCRYGRWVAVTDSEQMVGMGEYGQRSDFYHLNGYYIRLYVLPAWRGTGLWETLYETVIGELEKLSPHTARAFAYEERSDEVEFWKNQGFVEVMRNGEGQLELTTFDFDRYTEAERRFNEAGFTIRPITELTDDPERDEKLCAMHNVLMRDVPPAGERNTIDRETFIRVRLAPPDVLHDAFFIALSPEGEYMGMTQFLAARDSNPAALETGLTGVRPEWRRRGIALALKLHALREAKARGCTLVRTSNAAHNEPILELNRQMGYTRSPWHIQFMKTWEGTAE